MPLVSVPTLTKSGNNIDLYLAYDLSGALQGKPTGITGSIQYKDASGNFGGDSGLVYDGVSKITNSVTENSINLNDSNTVTIASLGATNIVYTDSTPGLLSVGYADIKNELILEEPVLIKANDEYGIDGQVLTSKGNGAGVRWEDNIKSIQFSSTAIGEITFTGFVEQTGNTFNFTGGSGGGVNSVVAGTNISVDSVDPVNPVVSVVSDPIFSGTVQGATISDGNGSTMTGGNINAQIINCTSISDGVLSINGGAVTGVTDITFTGVLSGGTASVASLDAQSGLIKTLGTVEGGTITDGNATITGGNINAQTINCTSISDGVLSINGGSITNANAITATGAIQGGSLATEGAINSTNGSISGQNLEDIRNATGTGENGYILQALGGGNGYKWVAPNGTVPSGTATIGSLTGFSTYYIRLPDGIVSDANAPISVTLQNPDGFSQNWIVYANLIISASSDGKNYIRVEFSFPVTSGFTTISWAINRPTENNTFITEVDPDT